MVFNPHKLGFHKVLKHIPLNAIFDAPYKRMVKKAVNIADLRRIGKARAHKVSRDVNRTVLTKHERLGLPPYTGTNIYIYIYTYI
jgi:hypothetical protein